MGETLAERLEAVRGRIAEACRRAGRSADEVRILPVTKTHGPETVEEAVGCGLRVFGESRVQEARRKIPLCAEGLSWHLVGHLQTNKVKDAVRLFDMVHSADSIRMLEALHAASETTGRAMRVFLEVNISGEGSKFGLPPDQVREALEQGNRLARVEVVGLMTVPPVAGDPEHARPYFRRLRELRDRLRTETGTALPELSMGMSHDFEVAVGEGATWVRLGSVLFGPRKPRPQGAGDADA